MASTTGSTDPGVAGTGLRRGQLRAEIVLVFAVSLGASGVFALLSLIDSLLATQSLSSQSASLIVTAYPDHSWLDLLYQLVHIAAAVAPALLALHLLDRTGTGPAAIGLDVTEPRRDAFTGATLAALIGGSGLALYLAAHYLGLAVTLVAVDLPPHWWRIPVELLSALHDGVLEEVLVVGYLLTRLRQLGWRDDRALALEAVIRGSYHLYQGFGGFAGNAVMGLIFGWIFQRRGRVAPLLLAHFLIDSVAFVGYTELAGHVSWLPS